MRPAVAQRMLVLRPPILHSWLSAAGPSRPRASPLKTDPWHASYFGSSQGTRQKKRPFGILSVFFSGGTVALPLAFQDSHPNGVACGGEDASGPAHHRAGVERRGERHRLSHARLGKLGSMPPPPFEHRRVAQGQSLHPIAQRRARVASHRAAQPSPRGGWQRRRAIIFANNGARQGIVRAGAAGFRARCEQQKLRRPAPAPGEHAHWWANPPMPLVPHAHCWTKPERTRQGLTQWVLCAQGRKAWGHCLIASVFQRSASTFERTKVRACPVSCCVRARRRQRPALDNYGVTLKFPRVLSRTASP